MSDLLLKVHCAVCIKSAFLKVKDNHILLHISSTILHLEILLGRRLVPVKKVYACQASKHSQDFSPDQLFNYSEKHELIRMIKSWVEKFSHLPKQGGDIT